jgi:hypothetical protein
MQQEEPITEVVATAGEERETAAASAVSLEEIATREVRQCACICDYDIY